MEANQIIRELLEGVKELNGEFQSGWDDVIERAENFLKSESELTDENFIKDYQALSDKYYKMSEKADRIHTETSELAIRMLPEIKNAIVENIFSKNMCFNGVWTHIDDGGKAMGDFFQLNSLGEIRELKEKESFPGPIYEESQLNIRWVEDRVKSRYFNYYYPNYKLLKSELNIEIKNISHE